ncbi:hypothetical protein B0H10DRAFT_1817855, partial [Mycena sp. CBHHK59/15]
YKPVSQKVRPVPGTLPDQFRIIREIHGDPLADMPHLDPNPPPFIPTGRYTAERRKGVPHLWPAERQFMHNFVCLQNGVFAWDESERGRFREDFFPPIDIPVIPHTPWIQRNMR